MPELPEVETIACDLRPYLIGRTFADVRINWPGAIHQLSPEQFAQQLLSRQVLDITRRGKYLVFLLSGGWHLLIHLRMTGQLLLGQLPPEAGKHVRLVFLFGDGLPLSFRDMRKFGRVYLTKDLDAVVGDLGPEPLASDFDGDAFASLLRQRKGIIKPLLLDQRFIAGLGNIYVDEALFVAGIHPCRRANTLQPGEISRLYDGIRQVLQQGIANRGTTLDDYRDSQGRPGNNQESLTVFRRAEEPCPRCGTLIQRIVVGGRGTYFCSRCQR